MEKLNPCFECGSKDIVLYERDGEIVILCNNCGAQRTSSGSSTLAKSCLIANWNSMEKRYEENCKKSYNFIEHPIIFPEDPYKQHYPDGLRFSWVGVCKNGTLTFGKETETSCEIILSYEIYPDDGKKAVYHSNPDLDKYYKYAKEYMELVYNKEPLLYAKVLDMLARHNFSTDKYINIIGGV